jgi:hypothetical protein
MLVFVGLVGHQNEGFPDRNEPAVEMADPFAPNFGLSNKCEGPLGRPAACQTSEEPEILVWGDSYAMHLVDGIVESEPDVKLIQMTMSGCGPLFDIAPVRIGEYTENWARRCIEFSNEVEAYLSLPHSVRYAVLSSPFDQYLSRGAKLYVEGKVVPATADLVEQRFLSTLNWLAAAGVTPVVVSPPPRNGRDIPLCLARSVWLGLAEDDCSISVQDFSKDQQNALRFLERIAQEFRVVFLPDYLCDGENCKVKLDEDYVYRDAGHLSRQGSRHLGMDMDFYRLVVEGGAVGGRAAPMPSE